MDAEERPENGSFSPRPRSHRWIALGLLAVIAGLAWETMGPGRLRTVVLVLLAFFGVRIAMTSSR